MALKKITFNIFKVSESCSKMPHSFSSPLFLTSFVPHPCFLSRLCLSKTENRNSDPMLNVATSYHFIRTGETDVIVMSEITMMSLPQTCSSHFQDQFLLSCLKCFHIYYTSSMGNIKKLFKELAVSGRIIQTEQKEISGLDLSSTWKKIQNFKLIHI